MQKLLVGNYTEGCLEAGYTFYFKCHLSIILVIIIAEWASLGVIGECDDPQQGPDAY